MDTCCLCSSAADKLPLLAMPVLVKQKLVLEAVTHLHLWCDHSKRHGSISLFSLHHTAWYTILEAALCLKSPFKPSTTLLPYLRATHPSVAIH